MRSRIDALDGVRGLALLAVLAYHTGPGTFRGGFLGVEVFFVLSGYLLTSSLLAEHGRGGIDHRAYASRRVRRLAPAGLVLLGALLVLAPLVAPEDAHRLRLDLLSSVTGLANWHLIADGASYFDRLGRPPFVRHLWSLAVEIQFCVVLSIGTAWLARHSRRWAARALVAGIAVSAALMYLLYRSPDPSRAYYGTDTRASALLTGALVAVLLAASRSEPAVVFARWVAPAAIVLGLLFFVADEQARLLYPAGFLVTQAATAMLIVAGVAEGPWARRLAWTPLRWFGRRSYGIYLWHWPIVLLMRPGIDVGWSPFVAGIVSIGAATVLGALSYRFVEAPMLRGRKLQVPKVFTQSPAHLRWAAGAAAMAMIAAFVGLGFRLPTVDPIEESLRVGEEVLAAQLPPTLPPAIETASPPTRQSELPKQQPIAARGAPAPVPLPAPRLAAFRAGSVSVTAVGDSVMLGGAPALHTKLGSGSYIDAKKNRRFSETPGLVRALRRQGRLGKVLIVHLGNNGPVTDQEVDALMREVKEVEHVLLVTVRVNKSWEGRVNEVLRGGEKRHKPIIVVDWHGYSRGHSDWFWSDGTHLRRAGADAYAKLVSGSIPAPEPKPKPKAKPKPKPTPTPNPIPIPTLPAPPQR